MYISTRGNKQRISAGSAIIEGLADDGGLFVVEVLPQLSLEKIAGFVELNYEQRANYILREFLTDYSKPQLDDCIRAAYGTGFDCAEIAPIKKLDNDKFILELWHGPTSAFKDMALQLLPHLLSSALKNKQETAKIVILVATSGDTGKAALEGFKDVAQTKIITFFPHNGVSETQRLQMLTQEGKNTSVVEVEGNFDDTQTGVKSIFNNTQLAKQLADHDYRLSSANSINWGRLVPQIVYYFSAYADWLKMTGAKAGDQINFVVPTGNFGNILAGYYAKCMGLPIKKLICGSNSNNVLTEFLTTGNYDRNRPFHKTISPSMDILVSSNLERLLYSITDGNVSKVRSWMSELNTSGSYTIDLPYLEKIQSDFWGGWVNEARICETIKKVYDKFGYVLDPHTAVAFSVHEKYIHETQDTTPAMIVSTASPFKFSDSVLSSIMSQVVKCTDREAITSLSQLTNWPVPEGLASLFQKPIQHQTTCDKQDMEDIVKQTLGISR